MYLAQCRRILLLLAATWGPAQVPPTAPLKPLSAPLQPIDPQVTHLKNLVDAAEKAWKEKDLKATAKHVDDAESLVADWPESLLRRQDVAELLERLKVVEAESQGGGEAPDLKASEEVVALTGEDLRVELEKVRAAEAGVTYDFPIDLNDKVATWVHLFTTSRKGSIERALSRGTRYLPMIRQTFLEEGVPQDLAYLAVIESGFVNHARSRAAAVGMWQFIRSSGKIYGLNNNAWVDERRDPHKATRAAARYLKRLKETRGDWYLALAGYNTGPLRVDQAVAAVGTSNFWDLARARYFRNETKNYVPELCAAILVGRNPAKYGLVVDQLEPYAFETVEVDKATSLQVLARFAGTDLDTLKELNPELLRGSTPPGRYTLKVPPGQGLATMRALARIPAQERLDFKRYTIRKGDTPAKVAARFKLTPEDLLQANDLKAAHFRVGRTLKVPPPPALPLSERSLAVGQEGNAAEAAKPLPPLPVTPEQTVSALPRDEEALPRPPLPDTRPAPPVADAKPTHHLVKSGETLFSIANRYGLDVPKLRKWNKLKGNTIQAGQRLRLQKP